MSDSQIETISNILNLIDDYSGTMFSPVKQESGSLQFFIYVSKKSTGLPQFVSKYLEKIHTRNFSHVLFVYNLHKIAFQSRIVSYYLFETAERMRNFIKLNLQNRPEAWRLETKKPGRDHIQMIDPDSWFHLHNGGSKYMGLF